MDARALLDTIENGYETELSRLGSSKALYAVTGGDMESEAVLGSMADRLAAAAATFESWADDGADPDAAATFAAVAEGVRGDADRIADAADVEAADAPTPLHGRLRELEGTAERAAGLAAWAAIEDRTLSQAVGFFVGSADPSSADLFRELRSANEERLEDALDLLADAADDPERAEAAAGEVVEAAYGHYVETLEGMGIKVKPVC